MAPEINPSIQGDSADLLTMYQLERSIFQRVYFDGNGQYPTELELARLLGYTTVNQLHRLELALYEIGSPMIELDGMSEDGIPRVEVIADPTAVSPFDQCCIDCEMERVRNISRSHLTEEERQLLKLHFGDDLSYRQIARGFGVPKSTIAHRIKRALEKLRLHLKP